MSIVLLVFHIVTLGMVFSFAVMFRDKLHFVHRSVADIETSLHSLARNLASQIMYGTRTAKEEICVSVNDTETQLSKRLTTVVSDLESYMELQRYGYISPLCKYDYLVPTSLLRLLIDRNRMSVVAQERDYLKELQLDILHNGIREPLIIAYDNRGQMMLQEGHHRLRVMDGFPVLPVRLKKVPRSAGTFNPVAIEKLFDAFAKEHYGPPY